MAIKVSAIQGPVINYSSKDGNSYMAKFVNVNEDGKDSLFVAVTNKSNPKTAKLMDTDTFVKSLDDNDDSSFNVDKEEYNIIPETYNPQLNVYA